MRHKRSYGDSVTFVPYDDENIEHVMAGPDYGQPESSSAWSEIDSVEYPDFVSVMEEKIKNTAPLKISKFP